MSEALLKNVQEMLNEEKWPRAPLSNYTTSQFKELDTVLKDARENRLENDLKKLCDEHLVHTKNSIIALYMGGMTALSQQIIDDSEMVNLVTIFVDNHKWGIVKYLCERMLDYGESKFALRTLADCYKNDNDEEAIYGIWERLVKVDYEEADLSKSLAERFEKLGDLENAVDYYKKALHRYIAKQLYSNVKEIWDKLLTYCPEDIDFFLHVEKRVAKNFDELKAGALLKEVQAVCMNRNDVDTAITVLKLILAYDNDDRQARNNITECYRKKYASHSQLEAYIRISSLAQGPRNVKEAVQDFEKHIAFDKGNFVFHRAWGVGRIAGVQGDNIVIDFAKKRGHAMSLKMAVDALQTLSKDHIWVLKATWKKEKLHDKVKSDCIWALKTVIESFGNSCDIKRIKSELVPSVLTASEWTSWGSVIPGAGKDEPSKRVKAPDILKTDPSFGLRPESMDLYMVRDRPISLDEKIYNEFKAARNFFERAQTIRNYIIQSDTEMDSEYFTEMFSYLTGFTKSYNQVNEQVVASYLITKELISHYPYLGPGIKLNFLEIFEGIEDVTEIFVNLKDPKLKEEFLRQIQLFVPAWEDIYLKLFPRFPHGFVILKLEENGSTDRLGSLAAGCFDNYRDCREAVVWLFKNANGKQWFINAAIPYEKQLITLIHILDICNREIENRRDTVDNRKLVKQINTILFKEEVMGNYFDQSDMETITRVYSFINDVRGLEPADKMNLYNRIIRKYPDFKFIGEEEKKVTSIGFKVTLRKYQEKQEELAHIIEVEIPANSKEIEAAKLHGDLSENAEYKAARERQTQLNSQASKIKEEIDRAQRFDPSLVNTSKVSFGTRVILLDKNSGERMEYTILGPWESDPKNLVINYLSPFGEAILNRARGDEVEFSTDEATTLYLVEEISSAF